MKVVIFGASGQVGLRLVEEMLLRKHDVTAFIFGPSPFVENKKLTVVRGDVHTAEDVASAIKGQDVVLSALGSWGTKTKDILSAGMRSIIPAMEQYGVRRIVSLTGADARDAGDTPNLVQNIGHLAFETIANQVLRDGQEHIALLRESELDWTVVRSPVMRNSGKHGRYRLAMKLPMPWASIHRKDVVAAMADLAEDKSYLKQAPVIYSK